MLADVLDHVQLEQVVELREQPQEDPRKGPAHGGFVLLDVEHFVKGAQGLWWVTELGAAATGLPGPQAPLPMPGWAWRIPAALAPPRDSASRARGYSQSAPLRPPWRPTGQGGERAGDVLTSRDVSCVRSESPTSLLGGRSFSFT